MTIFSNVNTTPATGAEAIFLLKEEMVNAGWFVARSGDGDALFNPSGDVISSGLGGTGGGVVAGGLRNNRAWFEIRQIDSGRAWLFQFDGIGSGQWRVLVSALDLFVTGAPGISQTPDATDGAGLTGGGTGASPSFAALMPGDSTYKWHIMADNTAIGSAVPTYGFWAFSTANGTGIKLTTIFQEPMDPNSFPELAAGTRLNPVTGDADPAIYVCRSFATAMQFTTISGSWNAQLSLGVNAPVMRGWYRMNYGDQSFDKFSGSVFRTANARRVPNNGSQGWGTNPYDGSDEAFPILMGRSTPDVNVRIGSKGFCNFLRMRSVVKNYPSTFNLDVANGAKIYVEDTIFPWETGTKAVV